MFLPSIDLFEVKKAVIFCPLPEWNYFSKKFDILKSFNWLNISIKKVSKNAIFCGPLISSPTLALLIEFLKNKGIKEILLIGWAGKSPFALLEIGDLFIPEKAYSLEGTSKFYYKRKKVFKPEKKFLLNIENLLKTFNIPFKLGKILTSDAPQVVEKNLNDFKLLLNKVQAMDMETSALYALSSYYKIKALSLLFITDEIGKTLYKRPELKIKTLREKLLLFLRNFVENKK